MPTQVQDRLLDAFAADRTASVHNLRKLLINPADTNNIDDTRDVMRVLNYDQKFLIKA